MDLNQDNGQQCEIQESGSQEHRYLPACLPLRDVNNNEASQQHEETKISDIDPMRIRSTAQKTGYGEKQERNQAGIKQKLPFLTDDNFTIRNDCGIQIFRSQ